MRFFNPRNIVYYYIGIGLSFCCVPATMISPSTNIERCHKYCKKNAKNDSSYLIKFSRNIIHKRMETVKPTKNPPMH